MSDFDPSQPNQMVQQVSDPARRGVTTGRTRHVGTRFYVEVEVGRHERVFIDRDDLEPLLAAAGSITELLESLRFGKASDLARILTYHKISSNLTNVYYAMQASRTDFFAYQFKPVYKFIESLNGRILITDEVGLGKTIEAGLIWLEARARSDARRLLVVCPPMLRDKWKQELRFRFNVQAEVYDSRGLISLVEDFRREGDNFQCAAVCSLPSVRQDGVQEALRGLEDLPYRFDLVVVDEAHHMRNVETKSHKAGALLSDLTESFVLLTATPIHLRNEDLFRLLYLLDADEFSSAELFERRLVANEPIVHAQNALRRIPADIEAARAHLDDLDGSWFADNPLVELTRTKLGALGARDHAGLVEAGRFLENLNLLGSIVSRTRKREVQEWRVLREPVVLGVDFNPREMQFYEAVTDAVRARVGASGGNSVAAFALIMPQQQMASCIPAMVEHYRRNPIEIDTTDEEMLEELGLFTEEFKDRIVGEKAELSAALQSLIEEWNPNTPDSKFDALAAGLQHLFADSVDSKVIIFSFFKKTLSYLRRRLGEAGYACAVIHGDVPMDERLAIIEDFKNDPRKQVLLSSEVGAEGIDLQFCRVLVNYDLPWNPMKVEQRIGRLDRLGQKSEKITVVNFAVHGTIEEKILGRLYDRIGIFRRSLGDLEPILGGVIQELTVDLLGRRLTPRQVEERIEQTQMAIEAKRQQEAELVEQSSVFFGTSDYILEQIGKAVELGRWITPEDLTGLIRDFFDRDYRGTRVSWNRPEQGLVSVSLSHDARNDFAQFCRSQTPSLTSILTHPTGEAAVLAYRPDAAQKHPRQEFLTHFHPLVRWIIDCHRREDSPFFPTAAVQVKTELLPPGDYLCAVEFWNFYGIRKEVQIAYAVVPLAAGDVAESVSAELLVRAILDHGKSWELADRVLDPARVMAAWDACSARLGSDREDAFNTFRQKTLAITQRRRAHLESFITRKGEALHKAIATLEARRAPESQVKAFRTRLANTKETLEAKLRQIDRESVTRDEFKEVAAVVCRVTN